MLCPERDAICERRCCQNSRFCQTYPDVNSKTNRGNYHIVQVLVHLSIPSYFDKLKYSPFFGYFDQWTSWEAHWKAVALMKGSCMTGCKSLAVVPLLNRPRWYGLVYKEGWDPWELMRVDEPLRRYFTLPVSLTDLWLQHGGPGPIP